MTYQRKSMNAIKGFFEWIMGWVIFGVIVVTIGWGVSFFSDDEDNTTKPAKETTISEDEKLIEVRKSYWDNGNLKEETPYKKSYSLGYKKVKTELVPHGIAKTYYENGVLRVEDPYVDGERDGIVKFYDENGKLESTHEYKNSKKEGKHVYYYSDGTEMDVEYYHDDVQVQAPVL